MDKGEEKKKEEVVEEPTVSYIYRLSPVVYAELERKLSLLAVREDTTALQIAEQIGIQRALKLIRDGFTAV